MGQRPLGFSCTIYLVFNISLLLHRGVDHHLDSPKSQFEAFKRGGGYIRWTILRRGQPFLVT